MSESRPLFTWESLEGEYTSWINIWAIDLSVIPERADFGWVDNHGTCYLQNNTTFNFNVIDRAGIRVLFPWRTDAFRDDRQQSVGNKYIVTWDRVAQMSLGVFRRGALIWTRLTTLDMPGLISLNWVGLSPNGRYIVVTGSLWGAAVDAALLYEGRP